MSRAHKSDPEEKTKSVTDSSVEKGEVISEQGRDLDL